MRLSLIVAVSENNVIGRDGQLPWHLSADLKRFKSLTMGHHIVMGRRTYESIGRRLPGRIMVVLTRNPDFAADGVTVAKDIDEALARISGDNEIFLIGGAEVYRQTLHRVSRIYLTTIHAEVEGDTHFPDVDLNQWALQEDERFPADEKNDHDYSFRVYDRKKQGRSRKAEGQTGKGRGAADDEPEPGGGESVTGNDVTQELVELTQRLLDAIAAGDWSTYDDLCHPTLTAFEPEARGHLVTGMDFHRFYFDLESQQGPVNTTVISPHVRLLGDDSAVVNLVRLIQRIGDAGRPETVRFEETRVWQRIDGRWQHVHFHRSANE